jgi:hypothetical protein
MYKESAYNRTDHTKNPHSQEMKNTFYQYYQNGNDVEDLNLADKTKAYAVGRYINKDAHTLYSNQLNNKGRSSIAFTER